MESLHLLVKIVWANQFKYTVRLILAIHESGGLRGLEKAVPIDNSFVGPLLACICVGIHLGPVQPIELTN